MKVRIPSHSVFLVFFAVITYIYIHFILPFVTVQILSRIG